MSGGIKLQWRDRNYAEDSHRIYRSDTPMTLTTMPTPIATVTSNVTEYIDYDVIQGNTYYYRIGAVLGADEAISDEMSLKADEFTVYTTDYDAFNDNSIVSMYNFDNNSTDLIGNSTLNLQSYPYIAGKFGNGLDMSTPTTGLSTITGLESLKFGSFSISLWLNLNNIYQSNGYILVQTDGTSGNQYVFIRIFENKLNVYDDVASYSSNELSPIGWNHVILTYDIDTFSISMYLNGVLDSTHTTNGFNQPFNETYFGSWRTGEYRYSGLLDHMRIFSKALSADECTLLFNEVDSGAA